jgi:hypothetical protein
MARTEVGQTLETTPDARRSCARALGDLSWIPVTRRWRSADGASDGCASSRVPTARGPAAGHGCLPCTQLVVVASSNAAKLRPADANG